MANLTLDGLETRLQEKYPKTSRRGRKAKVHLVRFADDFIITGASKQLLETEIDLYQTKWYFAPDTQKLMAFEVWIMNKTAKDDDNANAPDPCEVYLSYPEGKTVKGLAPQMQVRYGAATNDGTYGNLFLSNVEFGAGK